MKKIILLIIISSLYSFHAYTAEDKAKLKKKLKKPKFNTESKVTDWISGKEEFKFPNPLNGLKKVGKALKPTVLEKK